MGIIYQLETPLKAGRQTVDKLNIFKLELETFRPGATQAPRIDIYYAACDEFGTEIMTYNPDGKEVALLSTFDRLTFDKLSAEQKQAHKTLIQAIYAFMKSTNLLEPGTTKDV